MDHYPEIKNGHPRSLFTEQELSAFCGSGLNDEIRHAVVEKADRYVDEKEFIVSYPTIHVEVTVTLPLEQMTPLPEPPGYIDFPYWTMYSRAVEERMTALATAYALTGHTTYGEKLKEYVLTLSRFERWFEFPNRGAEGNLSNAHFTLAMAVGYDALFHMLNDKERNQIQKALLEKGLKPFTEDFENQDGHNIIASKRCAMLIGALVILEKPDSRAYFANARNYLLDYLDERLTSPDHEGLLYTNVAVRHILMAAAALKRTTGDDELIAHPYFKKLLPELFIYMMGNEENRTFVNFSDSFYSLDIRFTMGMIAQQNEHPVASWYYKQTESAKDHTLFTMNNMAKPIRPDLFFKGQNSKVFPTIGWAALRNGWGRESHLLAFLSGASAKDHNHFDQNNFVLHAAGEWLIVNPGYQDYVEGPRREFTLRTFGHNSMLVNGEGQVQLGKGGLASWFLSPAFDVCTGEAAGAYDGAIHSWERTWLQIDQAYFILVDKVRKQRAKDQLTFMYHTKAGVFVNGDKMAIGEAVQDERIDFIGDKGAVSFYPCYPPCVTNSLVQFDGAEDAVVSMKAETVAGQKDEWVITLLYPRSKEMMVEKGLAYEVCRRDGYLGLSVSREGGRVTDYVLINENHGAVQMHSDQAGLSAKGGKAWVSFDRQRQMPTKLAIFNGTELVFGAERYVKADCALHVVIERTLEALTYVIEAQRNTCLTIPVPPSATITHNGKDIRGDGDLLEVQVSVGENRIRISL